MSYATPAGGDICDLCVEKEIEVGQERSRKHSFLIETMPMSWFLIKSSDISFLRVQHFALPSPLHFVEIDIFYCTLYCLIDLRQLLRGHKILRDILARKFIFLFEFRSLMEWDINALLKNHRNTAFRIFFYKWWLLHSQWRSMERRDFRGFPL